MSDVVPLNSPPDAAAEPGPSSRKGKRATRKKAAAAKTGKKGSPRKGRNGAAAGATAPVKVGRHTITMPKSLATNLTSKDVKKLRAIFKRARKRGKKRSGKKTAKKSA